jgi:Kef-type K+ transport system membrane component KefB
MEADPTALAARFALQVGVVLLAAKLGAEVFERWLRQPAVLGELTVGVLIGPFALGSVPWPGVGMVFQEATTSSFAIPVPLWVFAEMAAVILLFATGLETDFASFVRFGPKAIVVAVGGVILPFIFGDIATVAAGFAPEFFSPEALFVGAALTATSVGVTARVLGDLGKLDSPEGVTILGAAVFDDVIGILVLAVVVSLAHGTGVSLVDVGLIGTRAVATWIVLTGVLVLASHRLAAFFSSFQSAGAPLALTIGLALVSGFLAQDAGLAMIVGAFSAGIALSRSRLRTDLEQQVRAVYHAIVPAFFVVVGMLVNVQALIPVLGFGVLLTAIAVASKLIGCGLTALGLGFRPIGALRIGVGMIPRGEVALIIAGIGLASGTMDQTVFAVIVFVAFATTVLAPIMLLPTFRRGGVGYGVPVVVTPGIEEVIELPTDLFTHFEHHLVRAFEERGFRIAGEWTGPDDSVVRDMRRQADTVIVRTLPLPDARRRVEIESETTPADWNMIVASAATAASAESSTLFNEIAAEANSRRRQPGARLLPGEVTPPAAGS